MNAIIKNAAAIKNAAVRFAKEEEGVTMVEYGLLVALIAVVVIVGSTLFGKNLCGMYNGLAITIKTPATAYAWTAC